MEDKKTSLHSLEKIASMFNYLVWDTCALVGCLGSDANEINFIDLMKQHLERGGGSYVTKNVIREYTSKNYWEKKLIPLIGGQKTDIIIAKRYDLVEVFREREKILEVGEKEEEISLRIINLSPNFMVKYGISAPDFEVLIYGFVIGFERESAAIVSNDSKLGDSFDELGNILRGYTQTIGFITRKEKNGFEILNPCN